MPRNQVIVVGGGIVALVTALCIPWFRPKTRLIIIKKENVIAQHHTSCNSGLINSGIYYKPELAQGY
jgi:L-2-hydroxyglutarate oxidase